MQNVAPLHPKTLGNPEFHALYIINGLTNQSKHTTLFILVSRGFCMFLIAARCKKECELPPMTHTAIEVLTEVNRKTQSIEHQLNIRNTRWSLYTQRPSQFCTWCALLGGFLGLDTAALQLEGLGKNSLMPEAPATLCGLQVDRRNAVAGDLQFPSLK